MFTHIMLGANDISESKAFYDAIMSELDIPEGQIDQRGRCFYKTDTGVFALTLPIDGEPATHGNGMTIGFHAKSKDAVDAWHAKGLESGGTECEAPPGIRDNGTRQLYLAYLRDPANNKICAVFPL
ncbi:VOC family protein [Vibrio palustris]|uniref:Glyoxalase-like domain protein n=1 Tax=Vibrio palustris TaxID=1918946 RepID=A0A1R4B380_9VIBR|nr:VOC family protein [Vibrio palustris]SJL83378.1 Glyoxalase-like domain protein [Vibrio palustris]